MPRKGENIYKRKDGRWEARYIKSRTTSGKAVYAYVYAKTYREVKTKLGQIIFRQNDPDMEVTTDQMFEDIALEWFEQTKTQVKEATGNKYWNLLRLYIVPNFGNKEVSEITNEYIRRQSDWLLKNGSQKGTGLSSKTVSDILNVLSNILKFAAQNGLALNCDVRTIQIKSQGKQMEVLSRKEQERLCQYLYDELNSYNVGILLCLFTGMRIGEVCALQWEDVSFLDKTIYIHRTLQRIQDRDNVGKSKTRIVISSPKSISSIRVIPIPDELLQLLRRHRAAFSGYLLTNDEKYIEPRTLQNHFKRALQVCEIRQINYHSLRHTFATRCIELGFDIKSLSEILGHASVNVTLNRYVHPPMELKKENMQKLSSLLAVK